jgi:hypothetical protein
VQGLGCRVWGSGFKVHGFEFRVPGFWVIQGFRVKVFEVHDLMLISFGVQGAGVKGSGLWVYRFGIFCYGFRMSVSRTAAGSVPSASSARMIANAPD